MTEKTGPGRPPLPPGQMRSTSLRIRMTRAEHRIISELARRTGKPAGRLMREYALDRARRLGITDTAPEPTK